MELKPGLKVKLRSGEIRGPLRDRTSENQYWPWGECCERCGSIPAGEKVWKPDGRSGKQEKDNPGASYDYDSNDPLPDDIIEIL